MKSLGLNPTETEIQDTINEVEDDGMVHFSDFVTIIGRKMREDDEENFQQVSNIHAFRRRENDRVCGKGAFLFPPPRVGSFLFF